MEQYDYKEDEYDSGDEDQDYSLGDMMNEMENKGEGGNYDYEFESDGEDDAEGGYLLGGARRARHHAGYKGVRHCVRERVGPSGRKRCVKYKRGGVLTGGYQTGGRVRSAWQEFSSRHLPGLLRQGVPFRQAIKQVSSMYHGKKGAGLITGGARGHKRGMRKGEHCLRHKVGPSGLKRCARYGMGYNYPLGIYD